MACLGVMLAGCAAPTRTVSDPRRSAAGLRRFRPIILTTLTTFGGLPPIILETSRQAYQLIPMAISLGIVFATAIILVLVPCSYLVQEDVVRKAEALRSSSSPRLRTEGAA